MFFNHFYIQESIPKIMTIAITGSNGYLGNFLTKYLTEKGYKVIGIDLASNPRQNTYKNFTFIKCDVRDKKIKTILEEHKVTHVIHTAYLMEPQRNKTYEMDVDINGSLNVFAAIRQTKSVTQFINISSTSVYGAFKDNKPWIKETQTPQPRDWVYAKHKVTVEKHLSSLKNLNIINFRLCTVVGPSYYKKGGVVQTLANGKIGLKLDNKYSVAQFIHEDDVKQIIEFTINDKKINGTFNMCSDSYSILKDLEPNTIYIPFPKFLFKTIIALLWNLKIINISPTSVNLIAHPIVASPDKLIDYFGYKFLYSTEEAYKDAVKKRRKLKTL